MKKNTNVAAVVVANAVVLSLIALNNYRPQLSKLAEDYVKSKRKYKQLNSNRYPKLETKKFIDKAVNVIGKPENLVSEALSTANVWNINPERVISQEVYSYITDKCMNYNNCNGVVAIDIKPLNVIKIPINTLHIENKLGYARIPALEGPVIQDSADVISIEAPISNMTPALPFGKLFGTMALIIALNSFGEKSLVSEMPIVDISQETIESTIEDLEDYLVDKMDVIVTLNNHEALIDRQVDRIMDQDVSINEKCISIFELDRLSNEEKINEVLHLEDVSYDEKFNFFINSGYFTFEEAMDIIISSNIVISSKVFDYIMELPNLTLDEKVNYIMHSDLTGYIRIFDYILNNPAIDEHLGIEYIANSDIAEYDEKFDYFMKTNNSLDQKVWNVLQIPNIEFEIIFNDLLSIDGISQDDVITALMQTELISFNTLFDNILDIENIDSQNVIDYLVYFNTYFNDTYTSVSLKDLISYSMNIKTFTYEEKLNCYWSLLDNLSIEEKQAFILEYYNIDYIEDYIPMSIGNRVNLTEKQKMILDLFDNINELKLEYVIEHYGFNNVEEFRELCAGCAAEGTCDYQDIYWVANTIFNRITHPWYSKKGTNPYVQFTLPRQFSVYGDKSYLSYLNPIDDLHAKKDAIANQAVLDMFYLGYDGVEHDFIEFRSWGLSDFSNNYVVAGGNRFNKTLKDEDRLILENLNGSDKFLQDNGNILLLAKN